MGVPEADRRRPFAPAPSFVLDFLHPNQENPRVSERICRECILRLKPYVPGKPIEEVERELGITNIVKMASNENPLGPSPKAIAARVQSRRAVRIAVCSRSQAGAWEPVMRSW